MRERRGRLPLDECRHIVGPGCGLADADLLEVRDQLYALARVMCRVDLPQVGVGSPPLSADERTDVDERAAILEFDGKLPRETAERLAIFRKVGRRPI